MLSEHTSIDEFFRNKEEGFVPGNSREDAHWQQMKTMLAGTAATPPHKRRYRHRRRSLVKYICGCAVIVLVTTVAITTYRHKKTVTVSKHTPAPTHYNNITAAQPVKRTTSTTATKTTIPVSTSRHITSVTVNRKPVVTKTTTTPKDPGYTDTMTAAKNTTEPVPAPAPDAATLLKLFYQQLEPQPQEFMIQNDRDTRLVAREGTSLLIPAGAFRNKNGLPPTGPIKIILTEYYDYDKIVAAGLSTSSNGRQLVSGGMVHVSAEADGQELQTQPAVNITVKMPTNNYDPRMQLFIGAPPTQSPLPEYTLVPRGHGDTASIIPVATTGNKRINWLPVEQWPETYTRSLVKVRDMRNKPAFVTYGKNTTATFHIRRGIGLNKEEIKKELEKRYGYYYDRIKVKYPGPLHWGIFSHETEFKWLTIGDSVNMGFSEALKYKLISPVDSLAYIQKITADSIRYFSGISKVKKEYTFNIRNLGWLNCDRFLNDPRPKIEFTLNLGEGYEAARFVSALLFTRFQSVMRGYYSDSRLLFPEIPENEPVQLICIGVKDGKVVTCIKPLTVSAREINNLHFEETTPEQFKIKLKALNLTSGD